MEHYQIQNHAVTFDRSSHQYWVDGNRVASVTEIINEALPQKPKKNVDPEILKKAAERGNQLHDMINAYERYGTKTYHMEMQGYIGLKTQHQFDVLENDTIVLLYHHGVVVGAGRIKMIVSSPYIKGKGIADIKRRLHLDEERLKLQLNFYKLGYEQTYKSKLHYLKCIHIRNHYRNYVDVLEDKAFTQSVLDTYTEKHPIDYNAWL